MPARSRTPAFIAGLKTMTTTAIADVPVLDGLQRRGGELPESVLIGAATLGSETRAASATQAWAAIGQHAREQNLNVSVLFVVQTGADDPTTARDRAYELLGLLEDALVADPTVGGVVRQAAVSDEELTYRANERGWAVLLAATVAGDVRLTP